MNSIASGTSICVPAGGGVSWPAWKARRAVRLASKASLTFFVPSVNVLLGHARPSPAPWPAWPCAALSAASAWVIVRPDRSTPPEVTPAAIGGSGTAVGAGVTVGAGRGRRGWALGRGRRRGREGGEQEGGREDGAHGGRGYSAPAPAGRGGALPRVSTPPRAAAHPGHRAGRGRAGRVARPRPRGRRSRAAGSAAQHSTAPTSATTPADHEDLVEPVEERRAAGLRSPARRAAGRAPKEMKSANEPSCALRDAAADGAGELARLAS